MHWIAMVENTSNRLGDGWFAVKQPNSRERSNDMSWQDAREHEKRFFRDTEPWSSIEGPARLRDQRPRRFAARLGDHGLAQHYALDASHSGGGV